MHCVADFVAEEAKDGDSLFSYNSFKSQVSGMFFFCVLFSTLKRCIIENKKQVK
jgi:hypothetical protein